MASSLAVHVFLALLQSFVYFRFGSTAENSLVIQMTLSHPFSPEDIKVVLDEVKDENIEPVGKWEVVCENEDLSLTCNAGEVINIMDAEFGRNDQTTCASYPFFSNTQCLKHRDVLYTVKQRCHNKRRCNMKSSTKEFGDPCPCIIKYLKVKYSCEPVKTAIRESVTVCEGGNKQLTCPKGTSILITDALYGRKDEVTCCCRLMYNKDCMAKGGLDIVSSQCDHKENCVVEAANRVFGDPCAGTIKYLQVDYLCLPNNVLHARYCEYTEVKLDCEKNSFIDVFDAHYGRAHPFICLKGDEPFLKEGCGTKDITSQVKERCQGKSSCVFPASNKLFGDPCQGYTKFLDVEYTCNNINQINIYPGASIGKTIDILTSKNTPTSPNIADSQASQ